MRVILSILTILTIQTICGQNKAFVGDTSFWFRYQGDLERKLELQNLLKPIDSNIFRYWSQGQVIEITENNESITAQVTYYAYHRKNRSSRRDTIFQKFKLGEENALNAFQLIHSSGILKIPSENKIKGWGHGFDGESFRFEYSTKDTFSYKTYWCPYAFDSVPEANIIWQFIQELEDTLGLTKSGYQFQRKMPRGIYSFGGTAQIDNRGPRFKVGYIGSFQTPYGITLESGINRIRDIYIGGTLRTSFMHDLNGNNDLYLNLAKYGLLINNQRRLGDYLSYSYRMRKNTASKYQTSLNHKMYYSLFYKYYSFGAGMDYMPRIDHIGLLVYSRKYFSKLRGAADCNVSFIKNRIDFKINLVKDLSFIRSRFFRNMELGLNFERFNKYNDVGCFIRIGII